jgi:hypothetical protein
MKQYEPIFFGGKETPWDRRRWKGGSAPTSSTTVAQNFSPEEAAARKAVMDQAAAVFNQNNQQLSNSPYPGSVPVGASAATGQAMGAATQAAGSQQQMAGMLPQAQQFGLQGVLDPSSNANLQKYIESAVRPITESYLDPGGVMSQIRSDFGAGQSGGSSRQALAEGVAAGRYANAVGDTTSKIVQGAYDKGLDTFSRTLALTPQTMNSLTTPASTLGAVGATQEGYQQAQNDYAANSRMWDLNAPWLPVQNYANIVFGGASPGTTTTQTGALPQRNYVAGALGGAATGAAVGSMIPGVGTAVGAGAGLLMSLFQ